VPAADILCCSRPVAPFYLKYDCLLVYCAVFLLSLSCSMVAFLISLDIGILLDNIFNYFRSAYSETKYFTVKFDLHLIRV
jgi:hypothetical protein